MSVVLRRILFGLACVALVGCGATGKGVGEAPSAAEVKRQAAQANQSNVAPQTARAAYGQPARLATLEGVTESSGLAASRRNPGLFWTHNDSGDGPLIYAFDRAGRARGVWRVGGARSLDWEDMAAGPGPTTGAGAYLYVGDIGDNQRRRAEVVVYRFAEPEVAPADAQTSARSPRETEKAEAIRLRYPDGNHDAESLLVHLASGDLYVVTKEMTGAAGVYKLAAPFNLSAVNTLTRVAAVRLPGFFGGLITGGDISPDGRRVVLCDYINAYELSLEGDAAGASSFDDIWTKSPLLVDLGERRQGEAVCYGADGEAVYATSEKRPVPLIEVKREK